MADLNLPSYPVKVKKEGNRPYIFDSLRKRFVALTPEEWVRQHFVNFLIHHKGYPSALIANEISLSLHNTTKRCDSVIYNQNRTPVMIVEYKAPHIPITSKVFEQISRYNIVLKVKYLVVSNGINHYCCKIDYDSLRYTYLEDIPNFEEL